MVEAVRFNSYFRSPPKGTAGVKKRSTVKASLDFQTNQSAIECRFLLHSYSVVVSKCVFIGNSVRILLDVTCLLSHNVFRRKHFSSAYAKNAN